MHIYECRTYTHKKSDTVNLILYLVQDRICSRHIQTHSAIPLLDYDALHRISQKRVSKCVWYVYSYGYEYAEIYCFFFASSYKSSALFRSALYDAFLNGYSNYIASSVCTLILFFFLYVKVFQTLLCFQTLIPFL